MTETLSLLTPRRRTTAPRSQEDIITALQESRGMVAVAARRLGIARPSLQARINKSPLLRQVVADEREYTTDGAELALVRAITAGEPWAVQFYLRTQGRKRGYGDSVQLTGDPAQPIQIHTIEVVKPPEPDGT